MQEATILSVADSKVIDKVSDGIKSEKMVG